MANRFLEPPRGEHGFVLIAAIWLLVLAGAIVALLMLSTMTFAKRTRFESNEFIDDLALESALQTVVADRAINGARSRWWLLPAEGDMTLGTRAMHVRLSNEAGRLDLNEADPKLIDTALRGLGAEASARQAFVNELAAMHLNHERVGSFGVIRSIARRTGVADSKGFCLEDDVTFTSGLAQPRSGQMPTELARALGSALDTIPGAGIGDSFRVEVTGAAGQYLRATMHIRGGRIPLAISSVTEQAGCAGRTIDDGEAP